MTNVINCLQLQGLQRQPVVTDQIQTYVGVVAQKATISFGPVLRELGSVCFL